MKKKLIGLFLVLVTVVVSLLVFSVTGSAEETETPEKGTVVFLSEGGTGDGSSALSPVSSLDDAYAALDLSKDCTIVVCGPFMQWIAWDYGTLYDGSVTFTSVYDGVDYRMTNDAIFRILYVNFVLWGDTRFEYIDFNCASANGVHVDCGLNPFTIGYDVNITGSNLNGTADSASFFIVGGYQNGRGDYLGDKNKNVDIKVYSGSNILINCWSRGLTGETYTGEANVLISGDASVGAVYLAGLQCKDCFFGKTTLTVEGNATVGGIYSTANTNNTEASLTVNWYGGTIGAANEYLNNPDSKVTYTEGRTLCASPAAKASDSFNAVRSFFDSVENVEAPETTEHIPPETDNIVETRPEGEDTEPSESETEAPGSQPAGSEPSESTPAGTAGGNEETEPSSPGDNEDKNPPIGLIIGIVAAVVVVVAVVVAVVVKKKKK